MTNVDIVIPTLNEERYIGPCLKSVLAFEKAPGTSVTIYVVDGGSTDRTRELVAATAAEHANLRWLHNPGRIQSCALNLALGQGTGDFVMRLDAHSFYSPEYLNLCLDTAMRTKADNIGGVVFARPGGGNYQARLVQALTTHRFGVGNAEFRLDAEEGPADTVPYGFFARAVFQRIGLFDERLVRAQDYEINRRIHAAGGTVWLNPKIVVFYHNQATLGKFFKKQIQREAPYNAYLWYLAPYAFASRHAITGFFAAGVLGGLCLGPLTHWIQFPFLAVMALYAILAAGSACQQAVRYREPWHALLLPGCFFLYHFLHGLGVLGGLARLVTGTSPVQKLKEPWPGAGRFRAWPPAAE